MIEQSLYVSVQWKLNSFNSDLLACLQASARTLSLTRARARIRANQVCPRGCVVGCANGHLRVPTVVISPPRQRAPTHKPRATVTAGTTDHRDREREFVRDYLASASSPTFALRGVHRFRTDYSYYSIFQEENGL